MHGHIPLTVSDDKHDLTRGHPTPSQRITLLYKYVHLCLCNGARKHICTIHTSYKTTVRNRNNGTILKPHLTLSFPGFNFVKLVKNRGFKCGPEMGQTYLVCVQLELSTPQRSAILSVIITLAINANSVKYTKLGNLFVTIMF